MLVSAVCLAHDFQNAGISIFTLPIGLSWIFSRTARMITWAFMGYSILWILFLTATLIPFLGDSPRLPILLQVIIGMAYLFPPVIATIMTGRFYAKQTSPIVKGKSGV